MGPTARLIVVLGVVLVLLIIVIIVLAVYIYRLRRTKTLESDEIPLQSLHEQGNFYPCIGLSGGENTIRHWMAARGLGGGRCLNTKWGFYDLQLNPSPGVILHDASEADRSGWKSSNKQVMVAGEDPVGEEDWPKNWIPSLADPVSTILSRIYDKRNKLKEGWI
ncbi:hypothetical protein F66182_6474 [Fusarium sp. NRRL 66182]|nr:hypothetical protein F66182_6474 [Fusarium sp. NRRL 66182]